jgi:arylsulfatase A-like enzyme
MLRVLSAVLGLLLAIGGAVTAEPPRTNVLFIMSDDMRPELGCYGHTQVKSPNIDALAARGIRFDRAYCQFPLCNPSRTSLLTGRHPTTTGVLDNRMWFGAAHPEFVSLPAHFKQHGYATLRTGKIFHGGIDDADAWSEGGEPRRFEGAVAPQPARPAADRAKQSDRIVMLEGDGESHGDFKTAERAIQYLRAKRDKPFLLACGFTKPHSPPTAPKRFFELYDVAKIPLPGDFAPRPAVPAGFPKASVTGNGDLFIQRDANAEEARKVIQAYWASISWVDWNVGRVLAELDRLKLRENTVVIFWGDHGYHLGEKGKWSKHGSLFEVGTRVPLIIAAPEAKSAVVRKPVQSLDLYPTLCELCGVPIPPGLEGHSLTPLLKNPEASWDHPAYSVSGGTNRLAGVAVRTERYRYAEWDGGKGGAMLFDHASDPHELKNLADEPALARVREDLAALARKHAAGGKPNK